MSNDILAEQLGQLVVKYAIEEGQHDNKAIIKLCGSLLECPSGKAFRRGLLIAVNQYFHYRINLRDSHFQMWANYLFFISSICSTLNLSTDEGKFFNLYVFKKECFM